jgi:hypothetical protein
MKDVLIFQRSNYNDGNNGNNSNNGNANGNGNGKKKKDENLTSDKVKFCNVRVKVGMFY